MISKYDWRNGISITSTLADLKWPTLAQRRQISRLGAFYQSIHQLIALRIPPHFGRTNRFTRHHHPLHFITLQTNTDNYKYNFFPELSMNGTIYLQVSSNCPPWNCFLIH